MGRLAIHRSLVGVREALGQNRCASGCEDGQSKKCRFHCVSPNQYPFCGIAFGFVLNRSYKQAAHFTNHAVSERRALNLSLVHGSVSIG